MTQNARDRMPAPVRLRSAGTGVILGGILFGVLSAFLPYAFAAGAVTALAVVAGVAGRTLGTWFLQLCLGVGVVGALGLAESGGTVGLGLTAPQLAVVAVAFGIFDVVIGTVLHRLQRRVE